MRVVAEVLHRVDERELEAGQIAVALEHLAHHHLEDAGVDGAGGDHLVQLLDRQARLRGGRARFGGGRGDRLRDEVVDELQRVAVPRRARVDDVLAERREHGLQLREHRVVGADHRVEPALLGLDRRARERRVDELARFAPKSIADRRRRRGLGGRRVDDDQSLARARQRCRRRRRRSARSAACRSRTGTRCPTLARRPRASSLPSRPAASRSSSGFRLRCARTVSG